MNMETPSPRPQKQVDVQVKYDDMTAKFASQVIVNGTREEVFLDFSGGVLVDQREGKAILPVHTRIAMTLPGAERLLQALGKILSEVRPAGTAGTRPAAQSKKESAGEKGGGIKASLPKI